MHMYTIKNGLLPVLLLATPEADLSLRFSSIR